MQIIKLVKMVRHPQLGNWMATIETDRFGEVTAFRQAGIGIWAFPQRTQLSENEKHTIDDALDSMIDE